IEETLRHTPGVQDVAVSFVQREAQVAFDPKQTGPRRLLRRVRRLGYRAWLPGDPPYDEEEGLLNRLLIGGVLAMHVMLISLMLYAREWLGWASPDTAWLAHFFQIMLLVDSFFASLLPEGSVAALYYSGRVNELALGAFAISISTVILPALSRHAAAGRINELRETLLYGLRIVAFVSLPSAVGLIVLRERIISVLFQHGRFTLRDTQFTAHALLYYAIGLFSFGAVKVLAPAFYSQKDTRTPAVIAGWTLGIHIGVVFVLSRLMAHAGIALADSLSATLNMTLLMGVFARRHGLSWVRGLLLSASRLLLAAGLMGAATIPMIRWMDGLVGDRPLGSIFSLVVTIAGSASLYLLLCRLLGSRELSALSAVLPHGRSKS
ncbi:MAG: lipid II flippase MurJ, partial [Acidobacteriota bacterium]